MEPWGGGGGVEVGGGGGRVCLSLTGSKVSSLGGRVSWPTAVLSKGGSWGGGGGGECDGVSVLCDNDSVLTDLSLSLESPLPQVC